MPTALSALKVLRDGNPPPTTAVPVDGLKAFPEAIEAMYPKTAVQLCLLHMVRHSLNYVSWKMRKVVAADLKTIYSAATPDVAQIRLYEFDD